MNLIQFYSKFLVLNFFEIKFYNFSLNLLKFKISILIQNFYFIFYFKFFLFKIIIYFGMIFV